MTDRLAYHLERIASRERELHKMFALPKSDCEYLEKAAAALRRAQAIEAGTDETRNAAQPEGRERGPKGAPK